MTTPLDESAMRAKHQAMRARHHVVENGYCACGQLTCDAIQALDENDALTVVVAEGVALVEMLTARADTLESHAREVLRTGEETERELAEARFARDEARSDWVTLVDQQVALEKTLAEARRDLDEWRTGAHADETGHLHRCAKINGVWSCVQGCAVTRAETAEREYAAAFKVQLLIQIEDLTADLARMREEIAVLRPGAEHYNAERIHANQAEAEIAKWRATAREMVEALRAVTGELDRLKVAYAHALEQHVEPPSLAILDQVRALLALPEVQRMRGR